jgi:hypothetical protein
MTHECPAAGCPREVSIDMLMCPGHWYMVPKALRTAVWNAWDDGAGTGTAQHTAAINSAIRSVNEKLAAKGITSTPGGAS